MRALTRSLLLGAASTGASRGPHSAIAADVEVVGLDYASKAPGELGAGPTVFRSRNAATMANELNIALLRPADYLGMTGIIRVSR